MDDLEGIRTKFLQLSQPSAHIKLFTQTDENIKKLAKHLMEDFLNMSDEFRNYEIIHSILAKNLNSPRALFYEIGNMQTIIGFINIIPHFKAGVLLVIIDKTIWGATIAREVKLLFNYIIDTFKLKRLSSETPDPRVVKVAQMMGFQIEGRKEKDFVWNNRLYTMFLLGRIKKDEIETIQSILPSNVKHITTGNTKYKLEGFKQNKIKRSHKKTFRED